eukprot:TRINITY_DN17142_c0_g1_i3.p1 TRINITY_DN17142_c0_g1~~TRINITY_DN17142_c0_g1_i3.p1  ORF type:complete len:417 (+),score=26.06 TRINITY_DN17142_c0_g1_i3:64-1314(+)
MNKRKRFNQQSEGRKSSKKWCDICQCWVAIGKFVEGLSAWEQHINGIKHRRKCVSQKYFNNDSGRVVSIFEEQPSSTYTSKDPAFFQIKSPPKNITDKDQIKQVLKQFQLELVHHLGVSSFAYQNVLNKVYEESVENVKQKMYEEIPMMKCQGKDVSRHDHNEVKIVHDNYVSLQAGFPVDEVFNPELNEAIANVSLYDDQNNSSQNHEEGRSPPKVNQLNNQKQLSLTWKNSLKTVELVALASFASDLEVYELSIPIQCSTDSNVNGANSAATVVLLQALAQNIYVNQLVLRYVLDKGEIAQYAGRQGLCYNGQHRIVTELLKFAEINSTVSQIEVRMPPGGFANVGIDELGQIHQMLRVTANAKLQVIQGLFSSEKSLFHILPEHVNQKILTLANLSQDQVMKRSFSFELEHPL